jgi:orotidine-5'-phosphate decarboxylase
MKILKPEERLIVAADFKPVYPYGRKWVRKQVLLLADELKGTGVFIKVNSALRACGYALIDEIHDRGLKVFADLKVFDISETLSTDGVLLKEAKPELLTTACVSGVVAMKALKDELPDTEVLGVTVLTSHKDVDTYAMYVCSMEAAVLRFANIGRAAKIDGLISSAKLAEMLREEFGIALTLNCPAIRPSWAIVPGDDQNLDLVMTPVKAISAGADRIVVGRPIIQASNPYDAVMRTIDEIASATA